LFLVARLRKAINADSYEMLDAVAVCWVGTDEQRRRLTVVTVGPESTPVT